ncbi:hypothetical protein EIMP300_59560 [Escherichia coli]|uniref:Uncharacterized protein n=2 Tax=Escherichia coli TaxID=562 RepID=A0A8S0FWU4_ECOLX|nr:hypothetical protein EIMP300_59560 [Escherichia coli]
MQGDLHGKRYSEELKIEAVKRVVERVYALPSDRKQRINRRKQFRLVYDAVVRQALCDAKER